MGRAAHKNEPPLDLSDIPEVSAGQWKRARRGPGRASGKRLELPLDGVRRALGKTQMEVSQGSRMAQADVSRIENSETLEEIKLGTLRRYVHALGARLELVVTLPDGPPIVIRSERRNKRGAGRRR